MKTIINKQALVNMLKGVKKGVKKDSKNIRIEAKGESLKLTSFGYNFEITTQSIVDVVEEGVIMIDYSMFEKVINMTEGLVTLHFKDDILKIKNNNSIYEIKADMANYINIKTSNFGRIKSSLLKESIQSVVYAISKEEINPILKGVTIHRIENNLDFVALDGFKMVVNTISDVRDWASSEITLDGLGLKVLETLLPKKGEITIQEEKKYLIFKFVNKENFSVKVKIIDSKAIDYKKLLPKNFNTSIFVNKKQLEKTLKNIVPLYKSNNHAIKLDINEKITLSFSNDNVKINTILDGKMVGENLEICFNPIYLLDIVTYIQSETIKIDFANQVSPCFVQYGNVQSILLPVRMVRK